MANSTEMTISLLLLGGMVSTMPSTDIRGLSLHVIPEVFAVEALPVPIDIAVPQAFSGSPASSRTVQPPRPRPQTLRSEKVILDTSSSPTNSVPIERFASNEAPSTSSSTAPVGSASNVRSGEMQPASPAVKRIPVTQIIPVETINFSGTSAPAAGQPLVGGVTPINVDPGTGPSNVAPIVPAVPEPASWLMMILGIGCLGLALRYRREEEVFDFQHPETA